MKKITTILFLFLMIDVCFFTTIKANVRMPHIFSDNMMFQRDMPVGICGWADPNEKVTVSYNGQSVSTRAGKDGNWCLTLKPMVFGGPFDMVIKGKNELIFKNTLIGDIWVCSGQSNMEWPLSQARDGNAEVKNADFPNIRLFTVPKDVSAKPLSDTKDSKWLVCSPETVGSFSAVGYFFGKDLYKHLNVPIGLIHSSWGGTNIETWISYETMYKDADYKKTLDYLGSVDFEQLKKDAELKSKQWMDTVTNSDRGMIEKWFLPETDTKSWKEIKAPGVWETQGYPGMDGVAWYRKEIELSQNEVGKNTILTLGFVDDNDETYVNGILVGKTSQYNKLRQYSLQPGILKAGKNVICVKVIDTGGDGGIWGDSNQLFLETDGIRKELAGTWLFRVSINLPVPRSADNPNSFPTLLYNAMIHPLVNFAIKGVIWYQGESNAENPMKYRSLFPSLISDWRNSWNEGNFPFLFVQLANYMAPSNEPGESKWAELREAQTMTLSVPKTGMATIIDIGEAKDIHPRNKTDVGYRLSLAARKVAFGENIVYSGPTYKSLTIKGDTAIIEFDNVGSGFYVKDKYGYINGFAIAGNDKHFVWAKAAIVGPNAIAVYSDKVKNPVAVRYAWGDNPDDVDLYNKEMLPAVPFRTDKK